ncbi:unnamed protein product [Peronospora belbahrii]|uniref:Syndetin C-terminal domain-containing protein n=1 Tax=Peronospora belbahrii TaxID=622444 RepID=A0ABN8D0A3_9STRA|nr:unnamed protein product [Peronospora belbahrii]
MSILVPQLDEDQVLNALDARFYTETFDPVAYMFENLPENTDDMKAFMHTEISAVDVVRDVIDTQLRADVQANQSTLLEGLNVVQEVDLDLIRAQIHVKNGRRLLATAKNDLVLRSLEIIKIKRNRDRVNEIIRLGSQIVQFFDEEKHMNEALQDRRFITAVGCRGLRKALSRNEFQGLTVVNDIRLRMKDFIPRLRKIFDQSLRKVAEHFDPLEYKELLQAYITLADHCENLGFEFSSYTLTEVLSNIPEIIVLAIDDIKRELMRQLFEAVSPKQAKNEKNTMQIEENDADNNDKPADVALTPASETVEKNDHYVEECHHSYSSKHRHGSDILKEPKVRSHNSENSNLDYSSSQMPLYNQILCDTGMTLLKYRKIVWENIQQNVLEMVGTLDTSYGYQMEHIIALSLATRTFTEIGEEFTGVSLLKIRSVLQAKCEQYLYAFHDDNIELARMLLETENWLRITTPSSDGDDKLSLLRLIEKRSGYFFERKVCKDLAANLIYLRRVFPSFYTEGNPFSAANSMEWLSTKQGIRFHHETSGDGSSGDMTLPSERHNQTLHVMDLDASELVLTSSSLSGFVRLCGVYLKMMEYLPHISWNVLHSLIGLFEFNVYVVFTNFIPVDDIIKFFHGRRGSLVKNDATRWNELRSAVCRTADDIKVGDVLLQSSVIIYPSATYDEKADQLQNSPMLRKVTLRKVTGTPSAVEDADESNLYALAERSIACETVIGQSRLLDAIEDLARSYLPDRYLCLMDEVYERNRTVAQELCSFMYSTIATRLVDVPALLESVSAVSWDISYISDQHNEYIVHWVRNCGEVWGRLQNLADRSIPVDAREDVWAAMVQTIMDTLLQAFSTAPNPTPQGRALMLLDLLALENGLDLINHVSSRTVPRGREYVSNYIKAFFYDEYELLEWVQDNKAFYSKIQFANLITNGIGPTLERKKLRELVLEIDAIIG